MRSSPDATNAPSPLRPTLGQEPRPLDHHRDRHRRLHHANRTGGPRSRCGCQRTTSNNTSNSATPKPATPPKDAPSTTPSSSSTPQPTAPASTSPSPAAAIRTPPTSPHPTTPPQSTSSQPPSPTNGSTNQHESANTNSHRTPPPRTTPDRRGRPPPATPGPTRQIINNLDPNSAEPDVSWRSSPPTDTRSPSNSTSRGASWPMPDNTHGLRPTNPPPQPSCRDRQHRKTVIAELPDTIVELEHDLAETDRAIPQLTARITDLETLGAQLPDLTNEHHDQRRATCRRPRPRQPERNRRGASPPDDRRHLTAKQRRSARCAQRDPAHPLRWPRPRHQHLTTSRQPRT